MSLQPTERAQALAPDLPSLAPAALHRSGAVARMLRMPVATLRVWERRYALTSPTLTAGGQRLYTADDVRRLALIKQLTERGHAIGSLAALNVQQLHGVASTHAQALAVTQRGRGLPLATTVTPAVAGQPTSASWRLVVVGAALASRLQRPGLLQRLARPVQLLGPFDDAAQAAAAVGNTGVDAVLIQRPQLTSGDPAAVGAREPAFAGVPHAVLYAFAADADCESLADAGVALLREPQPDAALAPWLRSLLQAAEAAHAGEGLPRGLSAIPLTQSAPPRRWDDAALVDFAGLSTTVACECPRHVAELLMQLTRFEAYSASCEQRGPADAALHAHLREVTAVSRAQFEAALEQVALHEGLLLPSSPHPRGR